MKSGLGATYAGHSIRATGCAGCSSSFLSSSASSSDDSSSSSLSDSTLTLTLSTTTYSSVLSPVLSLFGFLLPMSSFMTNSFDKISFSFFVAVQYLLIFKMFFPSHVMSRVVPRVSRCVLLTSKDIIPKSLELFALQRLHKKISNHVVGSAVLNLRVSLLNLIGYKEVTYV
jgi:hypothetical protein